MGHRVSGVISDVEHEAVPAVQLVGVSHLVGQQEHVRQDLRVLGAQRGGILDMAAGND